MKDFFEKLKGSTLQNKSCFSIKQYISNPLNFLILLAVLSLLMLFPTMRELVIRFGELLRGRQLNHAIWHTILLKCEFFFLITVTAVWLLATKKMSLFALCMVALLVLSTFTLHKLYSGGFRFGDYYGQSRLCAYTLHGINPFPLAGKDALIPELGKIPRGFGTTPWGLLLGNLFYPGFISAGAGKIYFALLNMICMQFFEFFIFLKFSKNSGAFKFLFPFMAFFSWTYWRAMHQGNCAGICCCFVILAILYNKEYPITAGILLAFAMTKVQIAGLVWLAFFLKKKWRTAFVTVTVCAVSWLIVTIMIKTSPVTLIKDFLAVNTGNGNNYQGIFTVLGGVLPQKLILPLSMVFGIAFVIFCHILLKNCQNQLITFMPACIASLFWCYTWQNDKFILFLPVMVCTAFMYFADSVPKKLVWFIAVIYLHLQTNVLNWFEKGIKLIYLKLPHLWWYSTTIYNIGLIILCVFIILKVRLSDYEKNCICI